MMLNHQLNSYVAVLIVTLVGAAATLFLVRIIFSISIQAVYAHEAVIYMNVQ
ncbi:MAG: hypothetical protein RLZZ26_154 [Candidatus Parcubacteria bacterium]|jgi:hypothetical protein